MKLSRLIEVFPSLTVLAQTKLPAKTGFRIAKAIALIRPEIIAYEEQRTKLAESLGNKTEDGSQFQFADDAAKQFIAQMNALTDEDVEITLPTISPDDLGDIAIEPQHLLALYGVVIADV